MDAGAAVNVRRIFVGKEKDFHASKGTPSRLVRGA
jgi:hypothetical protein